MLNIYKEFGISNEVYNYGSAVLKDLEERFRKIDEVAEYNQLKVIKAMQDHRVAAECFNTSTGYGYDDVGRDTLEKVTPLYLRQRMLLFVRRLPVELTPLH